MDKFKEFNKVVMPKVTWYDKVGYMKLGNVIAKIMLSQKRDNGKYMGYAVQVINKSTGVPMDKKFFPFTGNVKPKKITPDGAQDYYLYAPSIGDEFSFTQITEDTRGAFGLVMDAATEVDFKQLETAIVKYIAFFTE